jgi:hypothetical protein
MKIYQVIVTRVEECSAPNVEVSNFADTASAKDKFGKEVNSFEYDDEDYEVSKSDDDFECFLADDPLMDYGRVRLVEVEVS